MAHRYARMAMCIFATLLNSATVSAQAPAPTASPTPFACKSPDADAAVLRDAPEGDHPAGRHPGSYRVTVDVALTPDGSVVNTKIAHSSHIADLDQFASRTAHQTTFSPQGVGGRPVGGSGGATGISTVLTRVPAVIIIPYCKGFVRAVARVERRLRLCRTNLRGLTGAHSQA
jgi:TonB family protein